MSQSIDFSTVTDATFNGSTVEQINLNGTEIWKGGPPVFSLGTAYFRSTHGTSNQVEKFNGVAFDDGGVYVQMGGNYAGDPLATLQKIDPTTGSILWAKGTTNFTLDNGVIGWGTGLKRTGDYIILSTGGYGSYQRAFNYVGCFNASTGALIWDRWDGGQLNHNGNSTDRPSGARCYLDPDDPDSVFAIGTRPYLNSDAGNGQLFVTKFRMSDGAILASYCINQTEPDENKSRYIRYCSAAGVSNGVVTAFVSYRSAYGGGGGTYTMLVRLSTSNLSVVELLAGDKELGGYSSKPATAIIAIGSRYLMWGSISIFVYDTQTKELKRWGGGHKESSGITRAYWNVGYDRTSVEYDEAFPIALEAGGVQYADVNHQVFRDIAVTSSGVPYYPNANAKWRVGDATGGSFELEYDGAVCIGYNRNFVYAARTSGYSEVNGEDSLLLTQRLMTLSRDQVNTVTKNGVTFGKDVAPFAPATLIWVETRTFTTGMLPPYSNVEPVTWASPGWAWGSASIPSYTKY